MVQQVASRLGAQDPAPALQQMIHLAVHPQTPVVFREQLWALGERAGQFGGEVPWSEAYPIALGVGQDLLAATESEIAQLSMDHAKSQMIPQQLKDKRLEQPKALLDKQQKDARAAIGKTHAEWQGRLGRQIEYAKAQSMGQYMSVPREDSSGVENFITIDPDVWRRYEEWVAQVMRSWFDSAVPSMLTQLREGLGPVVGLPGVTGLDRGLFDPPAPEPAPPRSSEPPRHELDLPHPIVAIFRDLRGSIGLFGFLAMVVGAFLSVGNVVSGDGKSAGGSGLMLVRGLILVVGLVPAAWFAYRRSKREIEKQRVKVINDWKKEMDRFVERYTVEAATDNAKRLQLWLDRRKDAAVGLIDDWWNNTVQPTLAVWRLEVEDQVVAASQEAQRKGEQVSALRMYRGQLQTMLIQIQQRMFQLGIKTG